MDQYSWLNSCHAQLLEAIKAAEKDGKITPIDIMAFVSTELACVSSFLKNGGVSDVDMVMESDDDEPDTQVWPDEAGEQDMDEDGSDSGGESGDDAEPSTPVLPAGYFGEPDLKRARRE